VQVDKFEGEVFGTHLNCKICIKPQESYCDWRI